MIDSNRWLEQEVRLLSAIEGARLSAIRDIAHRCRAKVEQHDPYTKEHSARVAAWSRIISARLPTFDRARKDRLEITAVVHDYGKIRVSAAILNKSGPLSSSEQIEIERHPEYGVELLQPFAPWISLDGVRYHHVWYDGHGYPKRGLTAAEIPIEARIIAVCDVFDAMTADRAYRKGCRPSQALLEMKRVAGTQLDPTLVGIFEEYYLMQKGRRGASVGAKTMLLSVTVDQEIARAQEFLRWRIGDFDPEHPLRQVPDPEAVVREAVDHLVSFAVSRAAAEKFVRFAYRLPLAESLSREEIDLGEEELTGLRRQIETPSTDPRELVVPVHELSRTFMDQEIVVFSQQLWKPVIDGHQVILLR